MPKSAYKVEHVQINAAEAAAATTDLTKQAAPLVGFHVAGKCPSCTHDTVGVFSLVAVVQAGGQIQLAPPPTAPGKAAVAPEEGETTRAVENLRVAAIRCRCTGVHDGANGAFGCGSSWLVGTPTTIDATKAAQAEPELVAIAPAEEALWWPAAESVSTASTSALSAVQDTGTKWQTGVASVLAVAGLATITGARDSLHKINGYSEFFILLLGGLAIVGTAASIALALWANVGFPAMGNSSSAEILERADLEPLRRAFNSVTWLKRSSWCSLAAFVCAFAAILILLITPDLKSAAAATTTSAFASASR